MKEIDLECSRVHPSPTNGRSSFVLLKWHYSAAEERTHDEDDGRLLDEQQGRVSLRNALAGEEEFFYQ